MKTISKKKMQNPDFQAEVKQRLIENSQNQELIDAANTFLKVSSGPKYSYNFSWMGRPIIQYPQDMVAAQELIWQVKPDLIIEAGIAHGGSLILSASILAMLDYEEAVESGTVLDPKHPKRRVLGLDIDIRPHNRKAIEAHPMSGRIDMIEGSSTDPDVVSRVKQMAGDYETVMLFLDSNHTHDHVLGELNAYADLVSVGSYCVVFDTAIEDFPAEEYPDRNWGPGNNPKTAVWEFLSQNSHFEMDKEMEHKILVTVAPDGYLKRVR